VRPSRAASIAAFFFAATSPATGSVSRETGSR